MGRKEKWSGIGGWMDGRGRDGERFFDRDGVAGGAPKVGLGRNGRRGEPGSDVDRVRRDVRERDTTEEAGPVRREEEPPELGVEDPRLLLWNEGRVRHKVLSHLVGKVHRRRTKRSVVGTKGWPHRRLRVVVLHPPRREHGL